MNVPQKMTLMTQVVMGAFGSNVRIQGRGCPRVPSWTHSLRVMLRLQSYGYPAEVFLAGGAHDLIEDTDITAEFIRKEFGDRICFLTEACTLDPELGDSSAGEIDLHARVARLAASGDPDPLRIKIADSLDNITNIHTLNVDWKGDSLERGYAWLDLARKYITNEALVADFQAMLRREQQLMNV